MKPPVRAGGFVVFRGKKKDLTPQPLSLVGKGEQDFPPRCGEGLGEGSLSGLRPNAKAPYREAGLSRRCIKEVLSVNFVRLTPRCFGEDGCCLFEFG